jgi:hypothetical protein
VPPTPVSAAAGIAQSAQSNHTLIHARRLARPWFTVDTFIARPVMKVFISNPGATSPTPSAAGYSTSRGKACGHNVTFPVQPAALSAETRREA